MKRRRFLKAVLAAPAVPVLAAQQPAPPASAAATPNPQAAPAELPRLEMTAADEAAEMTARFFSAPQLAALRKLSDVLMPPMQGAPGALEAQAPEFLDFLLAQSPAERRQLYQAGLDALNDQARQRFGRPFAALDAAQAAALLAPLRQPWTYEPPADPLARFLQAAKQDVRIATMNSRQWSGGAGGGRRAGGVGQYWLPLD